MHTCYIFGRGLGPWVLDWTTLKESFKIDVEMCDELVQWVHRLEFKRPRRQSLSFFFHQKKCSLYSKGYKSLQGGFVV
jgi:hypothetical protein